ncbi:UNKNOWN [Stylonychia lemnae]|uniref:Uncharacterized protein n=1 Tax=Stylonychia lemnae TaxID=5949 RepID=A0A078ABA8_STYLE|nr:UNKNOWN [Stylonychia lemnae]|eukprot:CDW79171.1 UNKNOWN [Stylonychia lemnae]
MITWSIWLRNKYILAVGAGKYGYKGLIKVRLIKKKNCQYELIQDKKKLIEEGWIYSIANLKSNRIAAIIRLQICDYLQILNIKKGYLIYSIQLQKRPHLFPIHQYNFNLNPFAFIQDQESISIINLRNYSSTNLIALKFSDLKSRKKQQSLVNYKIKGKENFNTYKLIYLNKMQELTQIREVKIKIP